MAFVRDSVSRHSITARRVTLAIALACGTTMSVHARTFPEASGPAADPVSSSSPLAAPPTTPPPDFDASFITGRDFAGLRLPLAAVAGPISVRANRAWTWQEVDQAGFSNALDTPVHRLYLQGDVRITLGFYEFSAVSACIWIQQVEGATDGANVYQVFLYLEKTQTPDADAATSFFAERLPVRAVIDLTGTIELKADILNKGRPGVPLIGEGEGALARSLRNWVEGPSEDDEEETTAEGTGERPPSGALAGLSPAERFEPIFAKRGIITVSPGDVTLVSGETENSVILSNGVTVQYSDLGGGRGLRMNAQRAVIFLPPGKVDDLGRLRSEDVRGIYLEGDVVATDGKYTLRGPRIYYDLQKNRAMVIDAVFWTYEAHRKLPFYLRAESIRQQSRSEFVATRARITSTSFLDPELSIGASSLTIRQVPREPDDNAGGQGAFGGSGRSNLFATAAERGIPGEGLGANDAGGAGPIEAGLSARGLTDAPSDSSLTRTIVEADDITLRGMGIPFLYWPTFEGDPEQVPLRDIRVENSSGSGTAVKTTWNAYGLLGLRKRDWLDADIMLDAFFERGIAIGTRLNWREHDRRGNAFAYLVPNDTGEDLYAPGTKKERDGEVRGMVWADQVEKIDENWRLYLEGAYISDEGFVDAFFERDARNRREFTNRANLRYRDENSYFAIEAKGNANDFIANEYLLQTPGYVTGRTPEARYIRQFDDLIGSDDPELPGPILWTHEYRFGRLELQFDEPNAEERGFTNNSLAQRAFGIGRSQAIADRLRAQGYIEDGIFRADTRQALDMPLQWEELNITPYTVGRATVWDNDFGQYSPNEEDNMRLWYGAGTRVSTTVQRVDDSVDSRLFDLHRMRHIVTPYADFWQSGTNVDRVDLPVYDEEVEGIAEGGMATFGVDQTWQTQRGKAGKWHSVDVFKLGAAYTNSSRDSDRESPIGRFVSYRPELSNVGNFFNLDGVWQVSDALALSGSTVYDTDKSQQARSSLGAIVQHYPDFSSFIEMRSLNAEDSTHLDFGQAYKLSMKYRVAWVASYETNEGEFSDTAFEVQRSFPTAEFGFGVSYNNITSETSFGFVFRPTAAKGQGARLQGLGSSDERRQRSGW
jgi:hypothetical protein